MSRSVRSFQQARVFAAGYHEKVGASKLAERPVPVRVVWCVIATLAQGDTPYPATFSR